MDEEDPLRLLTGPMDSTGALHTVEYAFEKRGVPLPGRLDIRYGPDVAEQPSIELEDGGLVVVARDGPELKRLLGHYLLRPSWSAVDWALATRFRMSTLLSSALLVLLSLAAIPVATAFPALALTTGQAVTAIGSLLSYVLGYMVTWRRPKLLERLSQEMADLGCTTEYDAPLYAHRPLALRLAAYCILCSPLVGAYVFSMAVPLNGMVLSYMLSLLATVVMALLFTCAATYPRENPCTRGLYRGRYATRSELLERALGRVLETPTHRETIYELHGEFDNIEVSFRRVGQPQYRLFDDRVDGRTLKIRACDVDEGAALRLVTATAVLRSLPFYRELSSARRAAHLLAFFFGLFALGAVAVSYASYSVPVVTAVTMVASTVFILPWYVGFRDHEATRRALPGALRETGVFSGRQVEFYSKYTFRSTRLGDLQMLVIYHVFLLLVVWIVLIHF